MYFVQQLRDYVKNMSHRLTIPLVWICLMVILLMMTLFHQSSRIKQLEKRSIEEEDTKSKMSQSEDKELTESGWTDERTDQSFNYTLTMFNPLPPTLHESLHETTTDHMIKRGEYLAGSLYTRWGRTTCTPGLSHLVYTGIAGGQLYSQTGGASNYLCLPMDPLWGNVTSALEVAASIYGSEYELNSYVNLFSKANAKTLHDHNVPCTVCQTNEPAALFMLPGRNRCYSDWTLEYSGYLMTSHYDHVGRTEYLCIDKEPEADEAGYRDENGALFYPVQGVCGSLPCPPYVQGQELTCAVCSKRQGTIRYKLRHQEIA